MNRLADIRRREAVGDWEPHSPDRGDLIAVVDELRGALTAVVAAWPGPESPVLDTARQTLRKVADE